MEAPAGEEMTETVIETGLEATIEQIIPIQVNIRGTSILGEVRNRVSTIWEILEI